MAGNRKNNTAMVTALILGVHCCLPCMAAEAEEKLADAANVRADRGSVEVVTPDAWNVLQGDLEFGDFPEDVLGNQKLFLEYKDTFGENANTVGQGMPGTDGVGELAAEPEEESGGIGKGLLEDGDRGLQDMPNKNSDDTLEKESLQMPQKLEVVIDPWEMDGKGQIYSEEYVIQNMGEDAGILALSGLTCKPQEKSGAVVKTDRDGLHDDKTKSIYMEMLFSTGERIVLSEEGAAYEVELKSGEEVSLQFAGEVNEYASGSWDNEDITVGAVYSWDVKGDKADTSGDAEDIGEEEENGDVSGEKSGDVSGDISGDALGDKSEGGFGDMETPGDAAEGGSQAGGSDMDRENLPVDSQGEERTVDLDGSGDAEIGVDSWTVTVDGKPSSVWYTLRNTGKTTGMLTLSEPMCIGALQDEFTVRMLSGSEISLHEPENSELFAYMEQRKGEGLGKYVLIDLIPEDEGRKAAREESREISEYHAELKPGEEMIVCFSVRKDGMALKELEDGKAVVKARYSWVMEEVSGGYED